MCQRRSCSSQANRNLMIYDRDPRSHPKTPTGNLLAATHPHGNSSRPIGRAVLKRHLAKFLWWSAVLLTNFGLRGSLLLNAAFLQSRPPIVPTYCRTVLVSLIKPVTSL